MTEKQTYKLSPSCLNLMEECERCFWLHHHGKKRPEGIFPSLPNGMDLILKKHFDKFMEKGKLPPELETEECKDCKLFDDKKKLEEWRNSRKGLWIEDKEGNILHGGIDNLLVRKGKLIVLDYKTRGFPLKEDTAEHYRNQLDVYNFLLCELGYETENFSFLLFYYPREVLETGEVVFDTKLVKMKVDVESASRLWKKALKLLNGSCPAVHEEESEEEEKCPWCALLNEE